MKASVNWGEEEKQRRGFCEAAIARSVARMLGSQEGLDGIG